MQCANLFARYAHVSSKSSVGFLLHTHPEHGAVKHHTVPNNGQKITPTTRSTINPMVGPMILKSHQPTPFPNSQQNKKIHPPFPIYYVEVVYMYLLKRTNLVL